ncbi:MAG: histidine kinase [Bacteroidota bacterium]|nr:histidine kinase [Bacteroidota bacterium]
MKRVNKNIRKLTLFVSLAMAITFFYHNWLPNHKVEFSNSYLLHFILDSSFTCFILWITWEANVKVNKLLEKHLRWEAGPLRRLLLQVSLNTLHSFLLVFGFVLLYGLFLSQFVPASLRNAQSSGAYPVLNNAVVFFIEIFLLYQAVYIGFYFFRQWSNSLVESEKLKRENLSSQLQALQVQVNPHFLFNSLSSLVSLIEEDKTLATDFVQELANVYRYLLQQQNEPLVRICDEMTFISSFVYLHKARWGENLRTEMRIDQKYMNYLIPPQTIQILVENAIKHNVISASKPLTICFYNDDKLCFVVENNLQKKISTQNHTGIGLQNIRNRYRLLGKKDIIVENTDSIFRVKVEMISPEEANENSNN